MANVNSVSSSNSYSSLYNSGNTITGLATGMDTEGMIENLVSSYQTKITQIQQKQTQTEWKQDAMRSITDQMIALNSSFTSYTSSTNLSSAGFFTKNVTTTTEGTNAAKISATGRTSSDIQINSVSQLATSARYAVAGSALNFNDAVNLTGSAISANASDTKNISAITGSLTLTLGTSKYTIEFGEDDVYADAQAFVDGINEKLRDQDVDIEATLENGKINFQSTAGNGDAAYISGASGKLRSTLGVQYASSSAATNRFSFKSINVGGTALSTQQTMAEYLSDRTIDVTLDGVTKKISLGTLDANSADSLAEQIAANLQTNLDTAFGRGAVTVAEDGGKLAFGIGNAGSSLLVSSDIEELGIDSLSNYFNTGKSIGSLLGEDYFKVKGQGTAAQRADGNYYDEAGARVDQDGYLLDENGDTVYEAKDLVINGVTVGSFDKSTTMESLLNSINSSDAGVNVSYSKLTGQFVFSSTGTGSAQSIDFGGGLASRLFEQRQSTAEQKLGDLLDDNWFNSDGSVSMKFGITQKALTGLTRDSTLTDLMNAVNGAVRTSGVSYDEASDTFTLSTTSSSYSDVSEIMVSANGQSTSLAELLKGSDDVTVSAADSASYTAGKDAIVKATVNGTELELTRSSNVIDMDGLSVTLKGEFTTGEGEEAVSFKTNSDTAAITSAIKSFVDQYNSILKSVRSAYTTQPLVNSSGERYSPLTDDDMSDMSESAIAKYEEKAKTGLLFADSDLSSLYTKMSNLVNNSNMNLSSIGLTAKYSNGETTLELDENKLRSVLESDPDKVKNVFTQSREYGAATDGLMTQVKSLFNTYASTSLGSQGILVKKAGTTKSALSLTSNSFQTQIDALQTQIEKWQSKLSDKVDYYTKQFTRLEKLMSTYNNQSSMLSQMMGY